MLNPTTESRTAVASALDEAERSLVQTVDALTTDMRTLAEQIVFRVRNASEQGTAEEVSVRFLRNTAAMFQTLHARFRAAVAPTN